MHELYHLNNSINLNKKKKSLSCSLCTADSSSFLCPSPQVTKAETCVEVPTTVEFKVTGVQDAVVTIYDYYEPSKIYRLFFFHLEKHPHRYTYLRFEGLSQLFASSHFFFHLAGRRAEVTYTSKTRRDTSYCFFCGEDCSQCEDMQMSVFDNIVSSHHHQGLVQSLALLLLITYSFCF